MAATNFTPIILYHTTTASAAPTAGNLNNGELAININDGKLFYKDSGGTVQVIATKGTGTIGGSNTQVQYNSSGALAGSSNFTFNGTTATINTLNLTNALGTTHGGTGLNAYTTGDVVYASGTNTLAKLGIGANTYILTSTGSVPQWSAPSAVTVATATNLAGGAAGSVPYQSGAGVTTFLSIGTANQVLTSSGTAPQWSSGLTLTTLSTTGNTTLGDAAADNITINGTITSNLIFTDNTYDIGASGATRPRNLFIAGNITAGGNQTLTGTLTVDSTTDSSSTVTGSIQTDGGLGVAKALYVGTTANIAGAVTLGGGTANGVLYLNGSKVATSGSALTFNGSTLGVGGASPTIATAAVYADANGRGVAVVGRAADNGSTVDFYSNNSATRYGFVYADAGGVQFGSTAGLPTVFLANGSEQMRLTSTGLGIGTSSPGSVLDVRAAAGAGGFVTYVNTSAFSNTNVIETSYTLNNSNTGLATAAIIGVTNPAATGNSYGDIYFKTTNPTSGLVERMRLDSSGNLGLGVTPSAWVTTTTSRGMQFGRSGSIFYTTDLANATFGNNYYQDGSNSFKYLGSGFAQRYAQSDYDGSHAWFTAPSGTAGNTATFIQAMTLDASGNLGIGVTSISAAFEIKRGASAGALMEVAGNNNTPGTTSALYGQDAAGNAYAWNRANFNLYFGTNNTERARITSGGDLLVGDTTTSSNSGPGFKVYSPIAGHWDPAVVTSANNASYSCWDIYSTSAGAYRFYVTTTGVINATNTTISAISDIRYKENVRDLDVGLDAVMALKPRLYDWKEGKGANIKNARGFIAQEFEQVFPDLIDEWKDPAPEGEEPYKSVRQDLIPVLVKAIQEQQALITSLTARVATLEGTQP